MALRLIFPLLPQYNRSLLHCLCMSGFHWIMKGEIEEWGGGPWPLHFNHFYLSPVCVQKRMKPATVLLCWYITHYSFPSDKEPPKSIAIIKEMFGWWSHVFISFNVTLSRGCCFLFSLQPHLVFNFFSSLIVQKWSKNTLLITQLLITCIIRGSVAEWPSSQANEYSLRETEKENKCDKRRENENG